MLKILPLFFFFSSSVLATNATWNLNANGSWNVNANWTGGVFPNAIDDTANFLSVITANRTITLGQNITIGTVNFDDNNNYTLAGGGVNSLTFQVATGNAAIQITSANGTGSHAINNTLTSVSLNSPLTISSTSTAGTFSIATTIARGTNDLSLSLQNAGTVTLSAAISGNGNLLATITGTGSATVSGAISGNGGITKNGAGTGALILSSAANSYIGATSINEGSVSYNANGAIPAASIVTVGNGAAPNATLTIGAAMTLANALAITVNSDGTLTQNSAATIFLSSLQGSGTISASIATAATNFIDLVQNGNTTFSGSLLGGAASTSTSPVAANRFIKEGTGTLTVTGSSPAYLSRTFIENGVIEMQNGLALGTSGTGAVVYVDSNAGNNGTLLFNNITSTAKSIFLNGAGFSSTGAIHNFSGTNTVSGTVQVGFAGAGAASSATVQVDAGTSLTFSGLVSGATVGVNLTKTGTGSLFYTGGTANTFSQTTSVNAGTLQLSKTAGTNAIAGPLTINSGGTAQLTNANQLSDGANTSVVTLNSGGVFDMNSNAETFSAFIYNGGTILNSATMTVSNTSASAAAALSMAGTTIANNVVFSSTGRIAYTGTTVRALVTGNMSLGGSTHTFDIPRGSDSVDMELSGVMSGTGVVTLSNNGILLLDGSSTNTYSSTMTVNNGTLQLNKSGGTLALSGPLTINSGGAATCLAPNQFATATVVTVNTGGTFSMGSNAQQMARFVFNGGTFNQSALLTLLSNAAGTLTMGNGVTIPGNVAMTGSGGITCNATTLAATFSGTLDLGNSTHAANISVLNADPTQTTLNVSGVISGAGGITKSGGLGRLQFSGTSSNTYTGTTTISAGNLLLNKTSAIAIAGNIAFNDSSGSMDLGGNDQIANTSNMTLVSGTFNMNGFSDTINTLTYTSGIFNQGGGTLTLGTAGTALAINDGLSILGPIVFSSTGGLTKNGTTAVATFTNTSSLSLATGAHTFNIALLGGNPTATALNMGSAITGGGGITKTGTGQLEFSGADANSYSGLTTVTTGNVLLNKTLSGTLAVPGNLTINGGGVILNQAEQIVDTSVVTFSSGTFNLSSFAETIGSFTYTGGALLNVSTITLTSAGTALSMGNTTINGNLVIQNGTTIAFTGAGAKAINGNLTLSNATTTFSYASAAATATITGVIGGSGTGITLPAGSGTLVFAGGSANTYSGLTTVTGGSLQLNKTPTFNAIPGDLTINGGSVVANASDQIANVSNVLLTSGALNLGAFTETIGSFTYDAGTFTQSSLLTLTSALNALTMRNVTISGPLALTGGGAIVFDSTNDGTATISGNIDMGGFNTTFNIGDGTSDVDMLISGSLSNGSITKIGNGTLELSGSNTVGTVAVNNGILAVNGTLAGGGALSVASGATLRGTGTITKTGTINGTLVAGNSIGTIHFIGDQTLASGSTLEIEFNPSTADLVDIVGTVTIQPGSTISLFPDPGNYGVSTVYTIVHTTTGRTGTFSSVTSSFPLVRASVTYTAFDVLLDISFSNLSPLIPSGNAGAVAQCLDNLPSPPGSDLATIIDELRMLNTIEEITSALLQMQPSAFTALAIAQEDNTIYARNALYNRMEEWAYGCQETRKKGLSFWVSPFGAKTRQHNHGQEPGFKTETPGIFAGVDKAFGTNSMLGGGAGYTFSKLHWNQNRGKAHIQTGYVSVYGRWGALRGYVEGDLIGGYNFYSTDRRIQFGSDNQIDRIANGHHQGVEGAVNLKGALTLGSSAKLSPFAGIDYLFLHENAFDESGANSINLDVDSKNSDLLIAEAGINLSCCFKTSSSSSFTPYVQGSIIRESRFFGEHESGSLEAGCFMEVTGYYPSRTLGGAKAGFDANFYRGSISFNYQGKYGDNFKDSSLSLQFLLTF
jgi:fibronectin-binding autotransporter adhesin